MPPPRSPNILWVIVAVALALWLVLLTARMTLGGIAHALFAGAVVLGLYQILLGRRPV